MIGQTLILRADASPAIGAGHVMRCLALAQAWIDRGGKVILVGQVSSSALQQRLQSEGIEFIPCPPDRITDPLSLLKHALPEAWCVLDGYHLLPEYQQALRNAGRKVMVIDDIGHHRRYHADLLLNHNPGADQIQYATDGDTRLLLGPRYALLRREFSKPRPERIISANVLHILVLMGGSDPENHSLAILQSLTQSQLHLEIRCVVGPANPHRESLERLPRQPSVDLRLVDSPNDMTEYMDWADIAVSAAGVSAIELASRGVPMILLTVADNQEPGAHALATAGAALYLGQAQHHSQTRFEAMLPQAAPMHIRRQLSEKSIALVDGHGTSRLVSVLVGEQ